MIDSNECRCDSYHVPDASFSVPPFCLLVGLFQAKRLRETSRQLRLRGSALNHVPPYRAREGIHLILRLGPRRKSVTQDTLSDPTLRSRPERNPSIGVDWGEPRSKSFAVLFVTTLTAV